MVRPARPRAVIAAVAVAVALVAGACGSGARPSLDGTGAARVGTVPTARKWIEFAQTLVRETKPAPTEAARVYAYVATAYAEVRKTADVGQASEAARQITSVLYPDRQAQVDAFAATQPTATLTPSTLSVVNNLTRRVKQDPYSIELSGEARPTGAGYWVGNDPLTPKAGEWARWIVGGRNFTVPPPPVFGSPEYAAQLQQVRDAVLRRDGRWVEIINFWGGVPGTETPAGIWLNRFWDEVKQKALDDRDFAIKQSILAQTLADAFIECWKVKYEHWTARPDMVDGSIVAAMPNPNFPGYVSGHSTISAAAATVLAKLVPEKAERFATDARNARDSRLYAGIHFPADNDQGFALGQAVGEEVIARLGL